MAPSVVVAVDYPMDLSILPPIYGPTSDPMAHIVVISAQDRATRLFLEFRQSGPWSIHSLKASHRSAVSGIKTKHMVTPMTAESTYSDAFDARLSTLTRRSEITAGHRTKNPVATYHLGPCRSDNQPITGATTVAAIIGYNTSPVPSGPHRKMVARCSGMIVFSPACMLD